MFALSPPNANNQPIETMNIPEDYEQEEAIKEAELNAADEWQERQGLEIPGYDFDRPFGR